MGSIEVRNPLLSKKLKRTETRLLIIDDNQIRYNQICDLLTNNDYQVNAVLLDDLKSFEKQLNFNWDLIIFGRAYDLKYEQALSLVRLSQQPNLPMILLKGYLLPLHGFHQQLTLIFLHFAYLLYRRHPVLR